MKVIRLKELEAAHNEAESLGELTFLLHRTFRFMKAQSEACVKCATEKTKKKEKWILPCYCALCKDCCNTLAENYYKKKPLGSCSVHNIPYPDTIITRIVKKKVLQETEAEKLGELITKSK